MSELTEWVDRSQPPIGSFMVWKYYLLTGDRALLDAVYPALRDANFWWHTHRDGNGNGVYEYGSSPSARGISPYEARRHGRIVHGQLPDLR